MSIISIEIPNRDWKEFHIQGISGKIVKHDNQYKIEVEVMELPGEYVYYHSASPYKLTDDLIDKIVIGDIGQGGFHIRILCLYESESVM